MEGALKMLCDEHQNILKVIDLLLKECDLLQSGKKIDIDFFEKAIGFVREYADKFHHAKEEDILFVELCKDGVEMHCNPIEQMLHEHDLGRNFIKEMENWVSEDDTDKIIENAIWYAYLLQQHIAKEDDVLYPMADEALDQNTKDKMLAKFLQIDQKMLKAKEKHLLFLKESM